VVVSGLAEDLSEPSEELLVQEQEEFEEHLLERITALEDGIRRLSQAIASTGEHLAQLEHNLTVTHAGVQALGSLLETQGIVSRSEVIDGWERTVGQEFLSLDLARRFKDYSARILSQAEQSGHATADFKKRLKALELALLGPQLQLAHELLSELARMAPDSDELWSFIGELSFQTGDLDTARVALKRAIDLRGPSYESLLYLGTVASDLGRWEEATEALTRAREMFPEEYLPHFALGAMAALRGQHAEAVEHLEASLDREELAQSLFLLGSSRLKLGHSGRAIDALRRAVELDPQFEEALYQLGVAYLRRGWSRLALETFQQALSLDPQRLQYQETVHLLSLAPPRNLPPEAAHLVERAEAALERGKPEAALELFTSATTLAPEQAELRATSALLATTLGRAREAIASAHWLLRRDPRETPYQAAAVVALLESLRLVDRPRAARRLARRLYENRQEQLVKGLAAYELALVESELGEDLGGARELAREALEITPRELRHYPLGALGMIAIKRGRYREAERYLEQAAEAAPQPQLLRQLAVARLGAGDSEGAEEALEASQGEPEGGIGEELLGHVRRLGTLVEDLSKHQRGIRDRSREGTPSRGAR
jgi:tetratricopeptide (TPR) repeat protein